MPPSAYFASKSYQSLASGTISPGTDAIGSVLPSTLHSTSTPSRNSSTRTFSSWAKARSTAAAKSASRRTTLIPTLEPSRAGLTTHGKPKGQRASSPARTVRLRATGTPLSRMTDLNRSLSIASAEAVTPAPTYATPASSSRPWTVPSSPKGPCSTGKTTSNPPSGSTSPLPATGTGSESPVSPSSRWPAPRGSCQRPSAPISISRTS